MASFGNDYISEYLKLDADLLSRFADYEEMDDYPELSTALDIYADDATQPDTQNNRTMWVTSKDDNLKVVLDDLLHKKLRMDEESWEIARSLCKMGNDYEEILVTDEGVQGLNFLPAPTVRRIEGPSGELKGFLQDFQGKVGYSPEQFSAILKQRQAGGAIDNSLVALEDWEVAHFRLRGKMRRSLYGHSVMEPARWIWKRLMLLEDAALVFRLQRAPERYAMYVDVGDLPPQEALAYINKVRMGHKKRRFMDPATGKLNLRWEPLVQDEDFYIPVRKGQEGARIEVLGSPSWQSMEDVEYFRDKLFAAIKVPKAYLGQEGGVARAVLSSEDVRFARTVLRVQREIKNGIKKVCRVHLAALGIDPFDVDYDLWMTVPSSIFELAQLEVRNARADLAGRMKADVSHYWLLSKVYGMSDSEIECIMVEQGDDRKREAVQMAKAQQAGTEAVPQPAMVGPDGQPMPMPPPQAPVDPSGGLPQPMESRLWTPRSSAYSRLPGRTGNGITERELFAGNREHEKRADEKLEKLLKADGLMAGRMNEIQALLQDLRMAAKTRR
jgi:hypothetical protein